MPKFEYTGRRADGSQTTGYIEAADQDTAKTQLITQSITPIKIEAVGFSQEVSLSKLLYQFGLSRVSLDEIIMFSGQMYRLTKAGVPILSSLARLSESTDNLVLKHTLDNIATQISSGQTLSHALARHPKWFSHLYINIIEMGESTGKLDQAFLQITNYLKLESDTIKRLKAATRYPKFVILTIVIALLAVNIFVLPAFSKMFSQFGTELPLPTRVLLNISDFMSHNSLFVIGSLVVVIVGFIYWTKTGQGSFTWDRLKTRTPIFGAIFRKVILARFTRSFAIVVKSGVPILKGLALAASAVGNRYYTREMLKMRLGIEKGQTLTSVAVDSQLFSPLVLQMLEVGEESGSLDDMLSEAAEFYEAEVDRVLTGLSAALEPLLLTIIAVLVLGLAAGVFLPMWNMIQAARGS